MCIRNKVNVDILYIYGLLVPGKKYILSGGRHLIIWQSPYITCICIRSYFVLAHALDAECI